VIKGREKRLLPKQQRQRKAHATPSDLNQFTEGVALAIEHVPVNFHHAGNPNLG